MLRDSWVLVEWLEETVVLVSHKAVLFSTRPVSVASSEERTQHIISLFSSSIFLFPDTQNVKVEWSLFDGGEHLYLRGSLALSYDNSL